MTVGAFSIYAVIASLLGILFAGYLAMMVLKLPPGNERMIEISGAIYEGAMAYLNRQYKTIAVVGIIIAILLYFGLGWITTVGFIVGAVFSGLCGYVGMYVSVRSNARVCEAARKGLPYALLVAFKGGAVTGLMCVSLGLLGVAGLACIIPGSHLPGWLGLRRQFDQRVCPFRRWYLHQERRRRGRPGGQRWKQVYRKTTPRNPAVIADNVGDNVGDCAGMAADLFETYAITAIGAMLLGQLFFPGQQQYVVYPLILGGIAIIATIIGSYFVRLTRERKLCRLFIKGCLHLRLFPLLVFIR